MGGGGSVGGGVGLGGQGGCEWRSLFVCLFVFNDAPTEWRSEAFVKIQKKFFFGGGGGGGLGWGVRVDGNGELKLL